MLYEPFQGVRVQVQGDPDDLSDTDNLLVQTMGDFPPLTDLKNGDLCVLQKLRRDLRSRFRGSGVPKIGRAHV